MTSFNEKEFLTYRKANPDLRFFQCLHNYMDKYVYISDDIIAAIDVDLEDTYYMSDSK